MSDLLLYRQAVSIARVQGLLPPSPPPALDQAPEGSGIVFFSLHLARKLKPCSLPHMLTKSVGTLTGSSSLPYPSNFAVACRFDHS